jgi:hypothetical protein
VSQVKEGEKALRGEGLSAGAAGVMLRVLDRMDSVLGVFYDPPLLEGQRKEVGGLLLYGFNGRPTGCA